MPSDSSSMISFDPAGLRDSFRRLFRPGTAIYDDVLEGRQFDPLYFSMLVFGCLIALLGLLLNSPAVIIGAMLISPLMGPILSCALALTLADGTLAKKAGRNLGLSVVETILIAALAAWLSPLKDLTPEILARTNPNLMDLLIAFFSGAAGTLALCSNRAGFTIVPGVAIATAVMPPLATVGYGVSTRQWNIASGAFMLFVTNLASIVVSADIVFLLVGVRRVPTASDQEKSWLVRHRMAISWAILVVLSIPLVKTLVRAADQGRVRREIRSALGQRLNRPGRRRLDEVAVQLNRDTVSAQATVQTATMILPDEQKGLERYLSQRVGRTVILHIDQIQLVQESKPSAVAPGRDYVAGGKIRPEPEPSKLSIEEMLQRVRGSAHDDLAPILHAAGVEDFAIASVSDESAGGLGIAVTGTYQEEVLAPVGWKVISAAATQKFNLPVHLSAKMYLPQSQTSWLQYRGSESRPTTSELRKARSVLQDWTKRGLEHGFLVPLDAEAELYRRRVEYLQARLGEGLELPEELRRGCCDATNAVGIVPVQLIDVSAMPVAATPPPTAK